MLLLDSYYFDYDWLATFLWWGMFFVIVIALVPFIFYLLTLQNTLKAVSAPNRKMEPGKVWLLFIPLFNLVWQFFVITAVADSIEAEFKSRGLSTEFRPTYNLGLVLCILNCCSVIPFPLVHLAVLILWIIYWVKVAEYKNRLLQLPPNVANKENSIF